MKKLINLLLCSLMFVTILNVNIIAEENDQEVQTENINENLSNEVDLLNTSLTVNQPEIGMISSATLTVDGKTYQFIEDNFDRTNFVREWTALIDTKDELSKIFNKIIQI